MFIIALAAGLLISGLDVSAAPAAKPAVVRVTQGPLELTLRVLNPRKSASEPLLFQLAVRNTGRKPLVIADPAFGDATELASNSASGTGTRLEMFDPEGDAPIAVMGGASISQADDVGPLAQADEGPQAFALGAGKSTAVPCVETRKAAGNTYCVLKFWPVRRAGRHKLRATIEASVAQEGAQSDIIEFRKTTPWIDIIVRQ